MISTKFDHGRKREVKQKTHCSSHKNFTFSPRYLFILLLLLFIIIIIFVLVYVFLTYEVYDDDGIVTVLFVLPAVVIRIRQDEGGYVRGEYGGVQYEQQYHPVPDRFEGWIV